MSDTGPNSDVGDEMAPAEHSLEARVRDLEVEVYGYDPNQSAGDAAVVDVKRTIAFLDDRLDDDHRGAPIADVYRVTDVLGLSREVAEQAYEKLRRRGEVYEPVRDEVCVT